MNLDTFKDIVAEAGYELESYSGRGMYGNECASVHLDREQSMFQFLSEVTEAAFSHTESVADGHDDLQDWLVLMEQTKTDSMGLGMVLYWKRMAWDDSDEPSKD